MTVLPDVNIWLALALSGHQHHRAARSWLDGVDAPVRFCRATQQALLRLLTTKAVLAPFGNDPLTNEQAWAVYDAFLGDDRIEAPTGEPAGVESTWAALVCVATASPKLWMDAYLAAYAIRSGSQLVTVDGAFARFEGLDLLVLP